MSKFSLADLRPGDTVFGPIGGSAGALVGAGQLLVAPWKHQLTWRRWWKIRHCGVITQAATYDDRALRETGGPKMAQAEPGGMEEIELLPERHWTPEYVYLRPAYPGGEGQAENVAALAQRMAAARLPYGFACYPAIAAHRAHLPIPHLDRYIGATRPDGLPKRVMCSQAVDFALTFCGGLDGHGGVFDDGRKPGEVPPSELYLRLLDLGPELAIIPGQVAVKAGPGGSTRGLGRTSPFAPLLR